MPRVADTTTISNPKRYGYDLKISKITGVLALVGSFILTIIFYLIGTNLF